jgi:hypothetical protein
MCEAVQQHIEEHSLGPDDLLFPLWMFAYVRPESVRAIQAQDDGELLPPLVSRTGITYEHGTLGARYTMNCHCPKVQGVRQRLPAPVAAQADRQARGGRGATQRAYLVA